MVRIYGFEMVKEFVILVLKLFDLFYEYFGEGFGELDIVDLVRIFGII